MNGVLIGFLTIGVAIGTGYLLRRYGFLATHDVTFLNRIGVRVATPALLFVTIAATDVSSIFAPPFLVSAVAAATVVVLSVSLALILRWSPPRAVIGAMSASYVNSSNLGIPIATYVLGNTALIGPLILFQQIIYLPLGLVAIGLSTHSSASMGRRVIGAVINPVIVASVTALGLATFTIELPEWVQSPISLVGQLAIPAVLIAYGASLAETPFFALGRERVPVLAAVVLKCIVHPVAAFLIGALLFHLEGDDLAAVTLFAALPTAQNLFAYSAESPAAQGIAQKVIGLTTIVSLPILAIIAITLPSLTI